MSKKKKNQKKTTLKIIGILVAAIMITILIGISVSSMPFDGYIAQSSLVAGVNPPKVVKGPFELIWNEVDELSEETFTLNEGIQELWDEMDELVQGVEGPQGPQGEPGEQGPPGEIPQELLNKIDILSNKVVCSENDLLRYDDEDQTGDFQDSILDCEITTNGGDVFLSYCFEVYRNGGYEGGIQARIMDGDYEMDEPDPEDRVFGEYTSYQDIYTQDENLQAYNYCNMFLVENPGIGTHTFELQPKFMKCTPEEEGCTYFIQNRKINLEERLAS